MMWTTAFTSKTGSGIWTIIPTTFQTFTTLDSVAFASSTIGPNGDAMFNLAVSNHNTGSNPIGAMSFELLGSGRGSFRPSDVIAPIGWIVDSVKPSMAYFHSTGTGIAGGKTQSGFLLGLRSSAFPKIFPFVWRAYNLGDPGSFID